MYSYKKFGFSANNSSFLCIDLTIVWLYMFHALQETYPDLESALPHTDVLYMTRIQKERFPSVEEYQKVCCNLAT